MTAQASHEILDVSGVYRVAPDDAIMVIYQVGSDLNFVNSRWGPKKGTLSGDTIKAKVMLATLNGVCKDGVITWSTGHVATRIGPAPEDPAEATQLDKGWYPGKQLKEGLDKLEAAAKEKTTAKQLGQYERAGNQLAAKVNRMKTKRKLASRQGGAAIGSVSVSVLAGRFCTSRPYFLLEMDGNEERTHSAMTSNPQWGTGPLPKAEFSFPVYDPSSDLQLFLCDDESFVNELAIGRVIIPMRDLCFKGLLQRPKPTHRMRYQIIPATRQWSRQLEPRYEEAVPHVPGSGMVKPSKDLGYVDLELCLELSVPGHKRFGLLAAYAQVAPPDPWLPDDADELEGANSSSSTSDVKQGRGKDGPPPMAPKIIRGNFNRLKRCFCQPYLLQGPQVFALPPVLFAVCFYAEAYHLPWVALGLVLASGLLDHLHRDDRTRDMIFWEESVGETDMPQGLAGLKNLKGGLAQLQDVVGKIATFLERQRNFVNFVDGSVSFVALLCLTSIAALASALLYLLTLGTVSFVAGMAFLLPFMSTAMKKQPEQQQQQPQQQADSSSQVQPLLSEAKLTSKFVRMLFNVLGRVPDSKDIAHWHFCAQQVLGDAGAGGQDVRKELP